MGQLAHGLDQRFGVRAWLRGEPRPPRGGFDLEGEKILDWGWICVNLPEGPKRALEIGCGESPVIPAMLARGYDVTAVDFDARIAREISGFTFIRGDFNQVGLVPGFDVVVACSAIEHFGLSGRYRSDEDTNADLRAMKKVRSLLSKDGIVFLTIPIGLDAIHAPWHRVYGSERLPMLLEGLVIVRSRFLLKNPHGPWYETTLHNAFNHPVMLQRYALGEFVLSRQS
ncbi:MAG TPA: DUF268 domain-containing protein [Terriglobales bacterium]|nr:DUF268 domain-containing protein [Terriglobales bacterium]